MLFDTWARRTGGLLLCLASAPAGASVFGIGLDSAPVEMSQGVQQALIVHESGVQFMSIGMHYESARELERLSWIIPVPNVPEDVALGPAELFEELDDWLGPSWSSAGGAEPGAWSARDFSVTRRRSGGELRIHALEETEDTVMEQLEGWMDTNGYPAFAPGLLDYYVERDWSFVIVESELREGRRRNGSIGPIVLSFESPTAIMPLKLSTETGEFPVRMVLITDDPLEDAAFRTARERGFVVAANSSQDYLGSDAAPAGTLSVRQGSFAFSDAPDSLNRFLTTVGDWTVQESLELRYLTNPSFGSGVGMSLLWEEELSVPPLPRFVPDIAVAESLPITPIATNVGDEGTDENTGICGCSSGPRGAGSLAWLGSLSTILWLRRRSRGADFSAGRVGPVECWRNP